MDDDRMDDDPWTKTFFHRAIQTSIGRALRAQYDLSEPLPDRLTSLLHRLEEVAASPPLRESDAGPRARF